MPGFNKTGPFGAGPMTGGARGYCNPASVRYQSPFFEGAGFGGGMGFGRGFRGGMGFRGRGGFGRGFGGYPPPSNFSPYPYALDTSSELEMLKAQAESFKSTLDAINKRMAELEKLSE